MPERTSLGSAVAPQERRHRPAPYLGFEVPSASPSGTPADPRRTRERLRDREQLPGTLFSWDVPPLKRCANRRPHGQSVCRSRASGSADVIVTFQCLSSSLSVRCSDFPGRLQFQASASQRHAVMVAHPPCSFGADTSSIVVLPGKSNSKTLTRYFGDPVSIGPSLPPTSTATGI